jgi:hypothetical protein
MEMVKVELGARLVIVNEELNGSVFVCPGDQVRRYPVRLAPPLDGVVHPTVIDDSVADDTVRVGAEGATAKVV